MINTDLLKEKIIDLAMRGKLVEEDPADGDARELLQKFREEKEQLVKEKKIKKSKPLPPIMEDEIPYQIPKTWAWVRLGDVTSKIQYGYTASASTEGNAKMVRITDIENNQIKWNDLPYCTIEDDKLFDYSLNESDILIARTGGTIGKSTLIRENQKEVVFASYLIRLQFINKKISQYVFLFLQSGFFWAQLKKMSKGTGQPNVNSKNLSNLIFPMPPLLNQKRILDQIGIIFDDITTLDNEQANIIHYQSFLQDKVLDLAMRGKLVVQDPEEGTAADLLEEIKAERQRLVDEKKLKKTKPLPEIQEDETPYEIPETWEWVRLGEVCTLVSGRDLKKSQYLDGVEIGIPYLTGASNFNNGKLFTERYTKEASVVSNEGDLLITVKGTIGEMAFNTYQEAHIARQIMAINSCFVSLEFIKFVIQNSMNLLKRKAQSMIPGISRNDLLTLLVPMPPTKEQERIVAKLEEIKSEF